MKAENARDKMAQLRADIDSTIRGYLESKEVIRLWDGEMDSISELPKYASTDKDGYFHIVYYITEVTMEPNREFGEILCSLLESNKEKEDGVEYAFWFSLEELIDLLDAIEYTVSN